MRLVALDFYKICKEEARKTWIYDLFCLFNLMLLGETSVLSVTMWTRTTKSQAQWYLEQMM